MEMPRYSSTTVVPAPHSKGYDQNRDISNGQTITDLCASVKPAGKRPKLDGMFRDGLLNALSPLSTPLPIQTLMMPSHTPMSASKVAQALELLRSSCSKRKYFSPRLPFADDNDDEDHQPSSSSGTLSERKAHIASMLEQATMFAQIVQDSRHNDPLTPRSQMRSCISTPSFTLPYVEVETTTQPTRAVPAVRTTNPVEAAAPRPRYQRRNSFVIHKHRFPSTPNLLANAFFDVIPPPPPSSSSENNNNNKNNNKNNSSMMERNENTRKSVSFCPSAFSDMKYGEQGPFGLPYHETHQMMMQMGAATAAANSERHDHFMTAMQRLEKTSSFLSGTSHLDD